MTLRPLALGLTLGSFMASVLLMQASSGAQMTPGTLGAPSAPSAGPRGRPGDLDLTFNPCRAGGPPEACDGKADHNFLTQIDAESQATAVALQKDGKIVAVGEGFLATRFNINGELDRTFGKTGTVVPTLNRVAGFARAVAIQQDGKIVMSGHILRDSGFDSSAFALVRLNSDGSLDDGSPGDSTPGDRFGRDGLVLTDFRSPLEIALSRYGQSRAFGIAVQADGRIVASGARWNSLDADFALARYNPDGTADDDFGSGGKVTTDFGSGTSNLGTSNLLRADDVAYAVTLQQDGKIVAAGAAGCRPATPDSICDDPSTFGLARYNSNGTIDGGLLGTACVGLITSPCPGTATTQIEKAAVARSVDVYPPGDPNAGKIVLAGTSFGPSGLRSFALARYNNDLTLDGGFGSAGVVSTHIGGDSLTCSGDPPPTEGTGLGCASAYDGKVQSDGKVIAAGYAGYRDTARTDSCPNRVNRMVAAARYDLDGKLDPSFGNAGTLTQPVQSEPGVAYAAAIYPSSSPQAGKIVTAGARIRCKPNPASGGSAKAERKMALIRFDADGRPDGGFGTDGSGAVVVEKLTFLLAGGSSVAAQPDGKIVVGAFTLARYNPDGSLDGTFNPCEKTKDAECGGKRTTDFPSGCPASLPQGTTCDEGQLGWVESIIYPPEAGADAGKILSVGARSVRLLSDSSPQVTTLASPLLARYNPDGTLDRTFGSDPGYPGVVADTAGLGCYAAAVRVAFQAGGKIVTAGIGRDDCTVQFPASKFFSDLVIRYNQDGTLDRTFGSRNRPGTATSGMKIDNSDPFGHAPAGLEIYPPTSPNTGKIITVGNNDDKFAVARFSPDGMLDGSFSGGMVTTDIPDRPADAAYDVAIQNDEKIVAAGKSGPYCPTLTCRRHFALARYQPDGSLDTAFNPCQPGQKETGAACAGTVSTSFQKPGLDQSQFDAADGEAVAIDRDANIVVAGRALVETPGDGYNNVQEQFAVARYRPDGVLDSGCYGFGDGGKVTTGFPAGVATPVPAASAHDLAIQIQSDGKLVAAGNGGDGIAVARYYGESSECRISVDDVTVAEPRAGTTQAVFTVSRDAPLPSPVTVSYATKDGTAKAGEDYSATSGTVVFGPLEMEKKIAVDVLSDQIVEPDETFSLRLKDPVGAVLGKAEGIATIQDLPPRGPLPFPLGPPTPPIAKEIGPPSTLPVVPPGAGLAPRTDGPAFKPFKIPGARPIGGAFAFQAPLPPPGVIQAQQAQAQAQQQAQQQVQAQLMTGMMTERQKQVDVERAGLGGKDAFLSAARSRTSPVAAITAVWLGALMAFGLGLTYMRSTARSPETATSRKKQ